MALQHLRSSTANKRPVPGNMSDGQLGINTNTGSPGLFFKDSNNTLVKVGPVHVGTTAPNASPASGGTAGNSVGEQWLDTTGGTYVFKVWDGSAWRSESGTFVDVNGDVMTGALGIIAGSAGSPGLYFSGDTNTGIYSPGADQVAISTGGTGRLFVDASGRVGVGVASPSYSFHVANGALGITSFSNSIDGAGEVGLLLRGQNGSHNTSLLFSSSNTNFRTRQYFNVADGSLKWDTSSDGTTFSEKLRITSAGLVGVGTSSPQTGILDLTRNGTAGTVSSFRQLRIGLDANGNYSGFIGYGSSVAGQSAGLIIESLDNGAGSKTVINPSGGNVGIGTTSPGVPLEVRATTSTGQVQVIGSDNTNATWRLATPSTSVVAFGGATTHSVAFGGFSSGTEAFTERARIDSSGRLLVGTSGTSGYIGSTGCLGQFINTTNDFALGAERALNDPNGPSFVFRKTRAASPGGVTVVSNGDTMGLIRFSGTDGTTAVEAASIVAAVDGTPGTNDMPGRLVFSTTADGASSPTERMRIDSTGRCFFNTTASPSTTSFGTSIGTVLAHSRDTSTGAVAQIYGSAGEFRIIGSGNAQNTNNSYGAISDQSLKTDISDAGSQWDDIKGITVRKFKLIGTDNLQIGVVAQECELVSPGLVEDTVLEQEDGTTSTVKAVKYSVLYMKAVKALQEAMERIEQLEQRLAAAGI